MIQDLASIFIQAESNVMNDGDTLNAEFNTVMHNKRLIFSCTLPTEWTEKTELRLAHGDKEYAASWVILTAEKIQVGYKFAEPGIRINEPHGLNIKERLTVMIDVGYGYATVTVFTASGTYQKKDIAWAGRNGMIYAKIDGATVTDARLVWTCDDYKKDIYAFGDSYFNMGSTARWPYYLHKDGYDTCFMTGYPGMGCPRGIEDFRLSILRGKPKYAVWCLGMNNGDTATDINPDWLKTTTEFISTCKNNNIIPIICTIPTTPKVNNEFKNQWVRESGCRYIDFHKAVGAHIDKAWYEGMLHEDQVHPTDLGAQALYTQVLVDFPEITSR